MKSEILATVPAQLLYKESVTGLGLKEPYYIILIPKKIPDKIGVHNNDLNFDLILDKKYLSLRLALPPGVTEKDLRVLQDV